MKLKTFLKEEIRYLFVFLVYSFFITLLINNIACQILSFIISYFFEVLLFYKIKKVEKEKEKKISAYNFLTHLLDSIYNLKSFEASYNESLSFLIGYQESKSFDEIKELKDKSYNLYGYENVFAKVILADENNEVHIKDYLPIINKLNEEITTFKNENIKQEKEFKKTLLITLFTLLIMIVLLVTNTTLQEATKNVSYVISSFTLLTISLPLYLFGIYWRNK